ncbi:MAG: DUF1559 domain-containing protein [Pirellulales bacterium]|nr:DUF1559 domain-containing protein [Pirellulales bacterium]
MAIRVSCTCGKFYKAPDRLAGKTVRCPGCGKPLPITSPNEGDLLEELADLEAAAEQAGLSSVSGIDRQLAPSSSGTHLSSSSLKMASVKPTKSAPPVVNIVGGIIALVCLILIVILLARDPHHPMAGDGQSNFQPTQNLESTRGPKVTSVEGNSTTDPGMARQSDSGDGTGPVEVDPGTDSDPNGSSATAPAASRNDSRTSSPHATGQRGTGQPKSGTDTEPERPDHPGSHSTRSDTSTANNQTAEATGPGGKSKYIHGAMPKGILSWYDGGKDLLATRRPQETQMLELQYSWMVELLPHLGYQAEYDKLDFEKTWRDEPNLALVGKIIPEFLNPADNRKQYSGYMFSGLGLTHFVGMAGVDLSPNDCAARLPRSDPRAGIFGYREIARSDQITDGSSHTILLIGSGELAGPWAVAGGQTVRAAREPYFQRLSGFGSRGYDRNGATVLMADGSARWVDANIDPEVFRAMCTTHGGESIDLSETPLVLP